MWRVHSQDELVRRGKAVRDQLISAILSGKLNETQATWAIWAVGHIDKKNNNDEEQWNIEKFADNQWSLNGKANNTYKLNIRIQATRILGETEISAATPKLIKLLSDEEPRIRLAAIGSLDRIGWGNNSDTILEAIAYETDRVTFYSNWLDIAFAKWFCRYIRCSASVPSGCSNTAYRTTLSHRSRSSSRLL